LNENKIELVQAQEYEQAARIRDIIAGKKDKMESIYAQWLNRANEYEIVIKPNLIAKVVAEMTGIPVENIEEDESNKLLRIEEFLSSRVIGQKSAIDTLSRSIRRSRVGLGGEDKPNGSFIFIGPTGVGKTELARVLAEFLFGDSKSIIRLDMSEFMEKHSVSKLIGSPPGYVGYEEGGQLTEKVRRKPYSVVLLDEIEKSHPDIFNILLQILDQGELTDSSGITVSFRDTVIIMTSNIGNSNIDNSGTLGFNKTSKETFNKNNADASLKKIFSPEFLNRIDEVVIFNKLEIEHMIQIVNIMLEEVYEILKRNNIELKVLNPAKEYLISKGFDSKTGARNLRRLIQREIEDRVAEIILNEKEFEKLSIKITAKHDEIFLSYQKKDSKNKSPKKNKIDILVGT
jgi:ATP-dependent Clp protease ATP-binding subunit ClpC